MDVKLQSNEDFLKILIPKLEAVKQEQEKTELLNKKLQEVSLFLLYKGMLNLIYYV